MGEQGYAKKNWHLRAAAVMLLLVLLSFWRLSGLLARYTSSSEGGGAARVASFSVDASGSGEDLLVDCGRANSAAEYVITVRNDSETAVSYDVAVTFEKPLPEGVSVTLDGREPVISADGMTYSYEKAGALAAAGSSTEAAGSSAAASGSSIDAAGSSTEASGSSAAASSTGVTGTNTLQFTAGTSVNVDSAGMDGGYREDYAFRVSVNFIQID